MDVEEAEVIESCLRHFLENLVVWVPEVVVRFSDKTVEVPIEGLSWSDKAPRLSMVGDSFVSPGIGGPVRMHHASAVASLGYCAVLHGEHKDPAEQNTLSNPDAGSNSRPWVCLRINLVMERKRGLELISSYGSVGDDTDALLVNMSFRTLDPYIHTFYPHSPSLSACASKVPVALRGVHPLWSTSINPWTIAEF